jgi:hypothetical protein
MFILVYETTSDGDTAVYIYIYIVYIFVLLQNECIFHQAHWTLISAGKNIDYVLIKH